MKKKVLAILIATSMMLSIAVVSGKAVNNTGKTGVVVAENATTTGNTLGIDPPGW